MTRRQMVCETHLKERFSSTDLWCETHGMWVYGAETSEQWNQAHEKVRFYES